MALRSLLIPMLMLASSPVAAATADKVAAARALAARCDLAGAYFRMTEALASAEREWRPDAPDFLIVHQDLASYANRLFRFDVAERHARAAIQIAEKRQQIGFEHAVVSQNLAVALAGRRRFAEAEAIFRRITPVLAAAPDRAAEANAEIAFSDLEYAAGRPASGLQHAARAVAIARLAELPASLRATIYMRAADAYRRALMIVEAKRSVDEAARALGVPSPRLQLVQAAIAYEEGKFARALAMIDKVDAAASQPDACDPTFQVDLAHRRGTIHMVRRELPEAAAAFTRSLAGLARLKLGNNPREAETIYGLAVISGMSRDFGRSETLFDGTVQAFRTVYGGASEAEALTYSEKASMLGNAGRPWDAVAAAHRAVAILEGPVEQSALSKAYARAALGLALRQAGDAPGAQRELGLALAAFEDARGSASFDLAPGLSALGELALAQGRAADAEGYFRRALSIQRRWGGDSAMALGVSLSNLAAARAARGDSVGARDRSAEAVDVLRRRLAIGEARPWSDAQAERVAARSILTRDLALNMAGAAPGRLVAEKVVVERVADVSQLANATETGAAIAQMTTRLQQALPRLSALLGERNDLSAEWRSIQDEIVGGVVQKVETDDARRGAVLARQGVIADRLVMLDQEIGAIDPKLDLLIKSRTVTLAELREALRPGEAVLMMTIADDATYLVAVKATGAATFISGLTRAQAQSLVSRVRASLDPSRWTQELPAMDVEAAHRLFAELVAPAMSFLADSDTLLVIPDGPLASLPLGLLLTEASPPIGGDADDYSSLKWLIQRFAIAYYPSAASVVSLRALAGKAGSATSFLGVGAPAFAEGQAVATDGVLRSLSSSRLADVTMLRRLEPLPDAQTELVSLANSLGRANSKLLLGPDATERAVRGLPLDTYRVIAFATHGLVSGELVGYAEPGLVLTPPAIASAEDDGLLSASEVALLRMRADWVILTACNTAAGGGSLAAEPLSGLARSFFYAGARSLLVTNWAVESSAAAILSAATVQRTADGLVPAKALRETVLDFIADKDGSLRTHPFFWAPFSLIGG